MWVKICGIRDLETAKWVARMAPDAIGLNFFAESPRRVPEIAAAQIVRSLPDDVEPIGLFVNHPLLEIRRICEHVGLRCVQIHGDESPEFLAELKGLEIIRALRVGDGGLADVHGYLDRCRELGIRLRACLLDAHVAGSYGGTGRTAPWERIAAEYRRDVDPPLILAGGLTPENVVAAIDAVRPWGVDTAGGVEVAKACKDPDRVRQFLSFARGGTGVHAPGA
jgi:phosphoribosylanthranilate isomerase